MIRYILIFGMILFWAGCVGNGTYRTRLTGEIEGCKYGTALLVSADSARNILCSSEIDQGKFSLQGNLPEPGEYILKINHVEYILLLDEGESSVKCNVMTHTVKQTGGAVMEMEQVFDMWMDEKHKPRLNRVLQAYWDAQKRPEDKEQLERATTEYWGRKNLKYYAVRDFIQTYPNSIFSVQQALLMMKETVKGDYERGMEMYALLSPEMQQTALGKRLHDVIQVFTTVAKGQKIPAIEVETEDGSPEMVENLRGIWVIDFWASWCGPCRNEMVYLKEMYPEVHKLGVNMISISMDDNFAAWVKVNREEQIPWRSVRNKYGFKKGLGIREHLQFNAIPYILLVKDGHIVDRNLRRGNLKNRIMELLQE